MGIVGLRVRGGVGGGRLGGWAVGSAGSGCVSLSRRIYNTGNWRFRSMGVVS